MTSAPRLYRTEVVALMDDGQVHRFVQMDTHGFNMAIPGIRQLIGVRRSIVYTGRTRIEREARSYPRPLIAPKHRDSWPLKAAALVTFSILIGAAFAYFA